MANCLIHDSLADDDLSKLCMVLENVLPNYHCGSRFPEKSLHLFT